MNLVDLSIIIVNWNVADLLAACLNSIQSTIDSSSANLNLEIIVVDSGSNDHSIAMLRERYPHVKLLAQHENVGFTRGNNIGLEIAQGRYLLLLNPDTEVFADAIPQMVQYLNGNPDVGMVGPRTLNTDGSLQSTRRRFPTRVIGFLESTWLESFAPRSLLNRYYVKDQPDDEVFDVDWVQGSALMARREVYEQIGGLDTGYIMYWEELDWCKRAKDAGWRVVYLGTAQITHHGGKSSEQVSARRHIHFEESKLRYFRKYYGIGFATILRIFLLLTYGWQIMIEALKSLLGHKRPLRNERIKTYWRVLRSGLKVT